VGGITTGDGDVRPRQYAWRRVFIGAVLFLWTALLLFVFLVFVAAKVVANGNPNAMPWWGVFVPLWILLGSFIMIIIYTIVSKACGCVPRARTVPWIDVFALGIMTTMSLSTSIMLAEHLDNTGQDRPISIILLPLDVGLAVLFIVCLVFYACCRNKNSAAAQATRRARAASVSSKMDDPLLGGSEGFRATPTEDGEPEGDGGGGDGQQLPQPKRFALPPADAAAPV
jgi:hypothetical protein